jgi:hypothetical protein
MRNRTSSLFNYPVIWGVSIETRFSYITASCRLRMRRVLTIVACIYMMPLSASHIVGGEFELLHISGRQYRLNLIWYFDVVNNPGRVPEVQEPFIDVNIFRKSDNQMLRTVRLFYEPQKQRVGYTQPECSSGEIITDKLIYTTTIVLPYEDFDDPLGYYIAWERCCRNYNIVNIVSQNPEQGGIGAGQTFYLEFPAVVKDGQPFINSSPRLFPPLNDYACPGKPYYVDFAGVDDDGDSLAYTLVTPLNTHNANASPGVFPRPYPVITWQSNFGLNRIVNGSPASPDFPDLHISPDGYLRVTPRSIGVFVFAVKVEEFRNEEKIGESRRDFQMLVTDCRVSEAPTIVGKRLTETAFGTSESMSVSFSNTVSDENRCIIVRVTDPDAAREADNFTEFIRLKAVGLNFSKKDIPEILPAESVTLLHNDDAREFRICFPKCPFFEGGAAQIGIIAFDDACALPLSDTLKVTVTIEPPDNEPVSFTSGDVASILNEGDKVSWPFEAHDPDGDEIIYSAKTNGFLLTLAGMTIERSENDEDGTLTGSLTWDAYCDIYDFTQRTGFKIELTADDLDACDFNEPAVMNFDLSVLLPGNADPIADTDLTEDEQEVEVTVERQVLESLAFNVTANDKIDNDSVIIRLAGRGFKPSDYGMSFQKTKGKGQTESAFHWDLLCDKVDASQKDLFELLFIAVDTTNKCRARKRDTVHVFVNVRKPVNQPPSIAVASLNPNIPYENSEMHLVIGEPIRLSMILHDEDIGDEVRIDMVGATGNREPQGFVFNPARGPSPQTATFEWSPDCSIFTEGVFNNRYDFRFIYMDNHCQTVVADTLDVGIDIRDLLVTEFEVDPPNVFTPNGDSYNDYFAMERLLDGAVVSLLPPDNCAGQFRSVRIYNRWGRTVYESTERDFRWYGGSEAAGVYYYYIEYTNREYKGTVSLRD